MATSSDLISITIARIVNAAAQRDVRKFTDVCGDDAPKTMGAIRALNNPSMEDICAIDQDVWDYHFDIVKSRATKKLLEAREDYARSAANRALYLPSFTMVCRAAMKDNTPYWRFDTDLESAGLAVNILRDQGIDTGLPLALQIENKLPFVPDMHGEPTARRFAIDDEEYALLRKQGYRVSKDTVLWGWDHASNLLESLFPLAIDWVAYNHRMRAPLLPGGFIPGSKVSCVTVMTAYTPADYVTPTEEECKLLNMEVETFGRQIAGVDGSGLYDPNHKDMAEMVTRYGKVVFQISIACPKTGLFAKGIIVPRENACQEYGVDTGIILDHGMIKGARKDIHKAALGTDQIITYENVYVGVMKAWAKPGRMGAGFEQLENLQLSDPTYLIVVGQNGLKAKRDQEVDENETERRVTPGSRHRVYHNGNTTMATTVATFTNARGTYTLFRPDEEIVLRNEVARIGLPGGVIACTGIGAIAAMLKSLTREYIERIVKGGAAKLIGQVAAEDANTKLLVDFAAKVTDIVNDRAAKLVESGKLQASDMPKYIKENTINLMGVDMIRNAVEDRKQRRLWVAAQGAGIEGDQLVIVMDNAVTPGKCVTAQTRNGERCAVWRFPTIMASGLLVLTAQRPWRHHLVDGKVPPNTIYMHPEDVAKIQGDDDGDIIALSTDPRVVELFTLRQSNKFYAIEPEGQKLTMTTSSDEGWLYGQRDPMGPVGMLTVMRSSLLAVHDLDGAVAMSVMIQEAIDSAKRKVHWSNWAAAAIPENWIEVAPNHFVLHVKGVTDNYLPDGDKIDPQEMLAQVLEWCDERLNAFGCIRNKKQRQNPISWKRHEKEVEGTDGKTRRIKMRKRVPAAGWKKCEDKSNGFTGGNWVHRVHDWAREMWLAHEVEFMGEDNGRTVNLNGTLPRILEATGLKVKPRELSVEEYEKLSDRLGMTRFGKDLRHVMQDDYEDSDKRSREIAQATNALYVALRGATMQDLVDIWHYETTPRWRFKYEKRSGDWQYTTDEKVVHSLRLPAKCGPYLVNKPQRAFRAVTHPHSPIMERLDIEPETKCGFLTRTTKTGETRLEYIVSILMGGQTKNPYERLATTVFRDQSHANEERDAAGERPVPMHECAHCRETLQTGLVRAIRDGRQIKENEAMRNLTTWLGAQPRTWKPETMAQAEARGTNQYEEELYSEQSYNQELYG